MAKVILRPTIAPDLPAVIGETLPFRIKAITAVLEPSPDKGEGEAILGVGGLGFPPGGPVVAFVALAPSSSSEVRDREEASSSEVRDDGTKRKPEGARRYPVAFHRAGLMAMRMIKESRLNEVMATCDEDNAAAVRWLARLGFAPGEMQNVPGKIIWWWRRS